MNKRQVILIENLTQPEMIAISGGKGLKGICLKHLVGSITYNL